MSAAEVRTIIATPGLKDRTMAAMSDTVPIEIDHRD
jgi:hypothetical protein